ncbi:MAG TPA: nitroreductase family protein [Gaiellaceae bacterium]|nr:nitroreductase family protein [Gaiellaceae bacterium]
MTVALSGSHLEKMLTRRSIRDFSSEAVPMELIEDALRVAGSAPSGANQQPWTFVVITDPQVKARIREAAEHEERLLYAERASKEYLEAIEPIGTNALKPHITDAPVLIAVFEQAWRWENGEKRKHYYVRESVGIAVGFLITALHLSGLATLTHAPSPMGFLREILERPENERPFLLLPVGYPVEDAAVPDLEKKSLGDFAVFI